MRIWGISDLHLSFSTNKPMDIFGNNWVDHAQKMASNWDSLISAKDIVLCPGDLSWAMRLEEAKLDLEWIGSRPGIKILGRGNHDYWWSSIKKVRSALPPNCFALQNDAIDIGDFIVCGSRCWSAPGALDFTPNDQKIYERELLRLEMSLKEGQRIGAGKPMIAAIHYPPFTARQGPTEISALLEKFSVRICVYGHLHSQRSHATAVQGSVNGIDYHLIACDFLDFKPKLIWESAS